jgi:hypothetical protein
VRQDVGADGYIPLTHKQLMEAFVPQKSAWKEGA